MKRTAFAVLLASAISLIIPAVSQAGCRNVVHDGGAG